MTVVIPDKATKKEVALALKNLSKSSKKFNVDKYFGKLQWGQDALTFQRELRGE
jgi:hypothetical protein